jgi:CelD/BcsL family acetyltransferase involved in cellulose biosynthesis
MDRALVLSSLDKLSEIAPSLNNFRTFLSSPVGRTDWILSSAQYLRQQSELFLFLACDETQPLALAPLVRKNSLSTFRQLPTFEPAGFYYRDADALKRLTDLMAKARIPVFLERIPDDQVLLDALKQSHRGKALVIVKDSDTCPYIDIEGGADQTIAALPARLRSDLRRAARKTEELGGAACSLHAPTGPQEVETLWEKALSVEAAGWKGRSHTALLFDRQYRNFLHEYARRAAARGMLRINFLEIGGQTAATEIALVGGNRYWLLKIGFDERFSKCSPGMLLMEQTLRHAAELGLQSYEFMGTAADWTRRWTRKERKTYSVTIYPYTPQGAMLLVRDLLVRVRHKLRSGATCGEKTEKTVEAVLS